MNGQPAFVLNAYSKKFNNMRDHNLDRLQQKIDYQFQNTDLLKQALTHRSAGHKHNERLEFLGDAILNLTIADALFHQFPKCNEGELSRMRATLVREPTLFRRESILADCVEAIIGAISLDSSLTHATEIVIRWYQSLLKEIQPGDNQKDAKTRLQEYLQGKKLPVPTYNIVNIQGQAHNQLFIVECSIKNDDRTFIGKGSSRRKAEQAAAEQILQELNIK